MAEFVKVAVKSEIPDKVGKLVEVGEYQIALFKVDGKVHAIDAVCAHRGGPIHEGGLDGMLAMCPWHGWQFDLMSGECTFNSEIKQKVFEVKEQGEDVFVKV